MGWKILGLISGSSKRFVLFSDNVQTRSRPVRPGRFTPELKRPESTTDYLHPSRAAFKNERSYVSVLSICLHCLLRDKFTPFQAYSQNYEMRLLASYCLYVHLSVRMEQRSFYR
jgi:hypothetical protein